MMPNFINFCADYYNNIVKLITSTLTCYKPCPGWIKILGIPIPLHPLNAKIKQGEIEIANLNIFQIVITTKTDSILSEDVVNSFPVGPGITFQTLKCIQR